MMISVIDNAPRPVVRRVLKDNPEPNITSLFVTR